MSILRAEIAARVFNTPLMINEGKALAGLTAIGGRIVEGGLSFTSFDIEAVDHVAFQGGRVAMGRLGDRLGRLYQQYGEKPYDLVNGVAIIPIEGTLVHKGRYVGMSSGQTSYQGIQTQVSMALKDPEVKGVVFEADSFGGEVAGAFDTADMIAELSKVKPTVSILTDNALSAGYLLASSARQVIAPVDGRAGSIGAVAVHADFSKKLEKDGIKVTLLQAGKRKTEGNPYEPIDEDYAKARVAQLEAIRTRFAQHVAKMRPHSITEQAALDTEAAALGSDEALSIGLIDAIGKPSEVFDLFVRSVNNGV